MDNYIKKQYNDNIIEIYKDQGNHKWVLNVYISEKGLILNCDALKIDKLIKRLENFKNKVNTLKKYIDLVNANEYNEYKFKSFVELELDTNFKYTESFNEEYYI